MAIKRVYWDTSCFVSYLSGTHPDEVERSRICEDVLNCARNDGIEIWTSVWTIVETIRPRANSSPQPIPLWASLLNATNENDQLIHPEAPGKFQEIWAYYDKNTRGSRILPEEQAKRIRAMFDWSWIKKIQVFPAIAYRATEIARAYNMKPGDSLHVASALARNCEVIHCWDRDYEKAKSLIPSEEPQWINRQPGLNLEDPANRTLF